MGAEPDFPGTVAPERTWTLTSFGVRLNLIEWGDPAARPLLLTHGMWDHARSFAGFAPLLAKRWRVIAMDASGHGDSGWAQGYPWPMHVRDIVTAVRSLDQPVCLVGHSMGGGQATDAARALPELVTTLVNIDGFGPPDVLDGDKPVTVRCAEFLDAR